MTIIIIFLTPTEQNLGNPVASVHVQPDAISLDVEKGSQFQTLNTPFPSFFPVKSWIPLHSPAVFILTGYDIVESKSIQPKLDT